MLNFIKLASTWFSIKLVVINLYQFDIQFGCKHLRVAALVAVQQAK